MKTTVVGVMRMRGIGKESGNAYDFAQVIALRPIENVNSEKLTLSGMGFEVVKYDMAITSLAHFNDVKFPAELDLVIDTVPDRRGLKSVVVGIAKAPAVARAA